MAHSSMQRLLHTSRLEFGVYLTCKRVERLSIHESDAALSSGPGASVGLCGRLKGILQNVAGCCNDTY